jgi:hypothetical protein
MPGKAPARMPGACCFSTPARAGGSIEEQRRTGSNFSSTTETEPAEMLQRYGWEFLGPPPL